MTLASRVSCWRLGVKGGLFASAISSAISYFHYSRILNISVETGASTLEWEDDVSRGGPE